MQIPDIEYYSEKHGVCGYKEIKGDKLTPGIYKNMSDAEKDNLVQDIAFFLREMHSIPLPDIDELELNVIDEDIAILKADLNDEYYPIEQRFGLLVFHKIHHINPF